ncbi:MAG: hypothetical protein KJ645_11290, partial [Planctomycetes bacterium]|nr:hypothetical protein [Planctomycetota bacterium]
MFFVFTYGLFLFLYFDQPLLTERTVDHVLELLTEEQVLSRLNLNLNIDPDSSRLEGNARMAFELPQQKPHPLLPHLIHSLLFLHPDLVFHLNPSLGIKRISWGDRLLKFRRIKSMVFVDIGAPVPEDCVVELDVVYGGYLSQGEEQSIITPHFVYLDPQDAYYPFQKGIRSQVSLEPELPADLTVVTPAFDQPVQSFALVGYPSTMKSHHSKLLDFALFGWGENEAAITENLAAICDFLENRLPPPAVRSFRLIKCPSNLEIGVRYDDTGTILVPDEISMEDLAFLIARCWILSEQQEKKTLFTREDIARAIALYFIQRFEGESAFGAGLLRLCHGSRSGIVFQESESIASHPRGDDYRVGGDTRGYHLSMFRRIVGDVAFDQILKMMLLQMKRNMASGWESWNELVRSFTGEDLGWLFRNWVYKERQVDLAIDHLAVEEHALGQKVSITIENRGDLQLPEKVKVLFITETGAVHEYLSVSQVKKEFVRFIHDRVTGVVMDPDLAWYDTDRSNNLVYVDPAPVLMMPSEDNRYLAMVYPKRIGYEQYPLAIIGNGSDIRQIYSLELPVEKMRWISARRLLITTRQQPDPSDPDMALPAHYLIDTEQEEVTYFGPGVDLQASESGRYLLLNYQQDDRWIHKLKDLDNKLTRGLLSGISKSVPYRLQWLSGTDLIIPVYPYDFQGRYAIYSLEGDETNWFLVHDERIYGMHGFGEGLVFLREKGESKGFFTKNTDDRMARLKVRLTGEPVDFKVSKSGGTLFWWEGLPEEQIRVLRYDATLEKKETLFEGPAQGLYPVFCDKGVLIKKNRLRENGSRGEDILFYRFGEGEGIFITDSAAPERIFALVGNQRYLYYAEEIESPWSPLSIYNHRRFYCYDFLNRENHVLDFGSQ